MSLRKITIIGLGLIGGSLARALKETNFTEIVSGVDTDKDSIKYAISEHIIDEGSTDIEECSRDADIIVIATHVGAIKDAALSAAASAPNGAVITDTGSVKGKLLHDIEGILPDNISFVGAHPIAGTENSGIRFSDGTLFKGRRCILTPTERTDREALGKVARMWEAIGAEVFEMEADTHDRIFGAVSHLPHAIAYSLINSVLSAENHEELFEFAGGGLKDYTRIAASSPEMWTDIFLSNSAHTLEAISRFQEALEKIKSAIEKNDEASLTDELSKAKELKKKSMMQDKKGKR
jgi:prephenate dehydrogenase